MTALERRARYTSIVQRLSSQLRREICASRASGLLQLEVFFLYSSPSCRVLHGLFGPLSSLYTLDNPCLFLFLIGEWIRNLLATIEGTDEDEESASSDYETERTRRSVTFIIWHNRPSATQAGENSSKVEQKMGQNIPCSNSLTSSSTKFIN